LRGKANRGRVRVELCRSGAARFRAVSAALPATQKRSKVVGAKATQVRMPPLDHRTAARYRARRKWNSRVAGFERGLQGMISLDTNLLFFAFAEDRPEHARAKSFVDEYSNRNDVVISEFVLVELYRLIRNPAVLKKPLQAREATEVAQTWRRHPRWRLAGFTEESKRLHDELWKAVSRSGFAYRRIFDARLALVLRHQGVREFATNNVKDFEGLGFERVWNPLEDQRKTNPRETK
jgi:toxin-antitoxin system PIN domain toxin